LGIDDPDCHGVIRCEVGPRHREDGVRARAFVFDADGGSYDGGWSGRNGGGNRGLMNVLTVANHLTGLIGVDDIEADPAIHRVLAGAAVEVVVAVVAGEVVVAGAAVELVVAGAADQPVVTAIAIEDVVAAVPRIASA
jgi:hypothetical protein